MIKKIFSILFVLSIVIWLAGFMLFAYRINHYQTDDITHTQAIVALTGGRNRIAEAVRLLDAGKADILFISGVGQQISFNDIKKQQGIHPKAGDNKINIGQQARDTAGNAVETTRWLRQNQINSIRLVTSNYHVDRSLAEFKSQNPELLIIPHPVYSENVEKKWWKSWHTFSLIFSEYNKFLLAYLSGNLGLRG